MRPFWISLLALFSVSAMAQESWQLVESDNGVSVYTRQEPGKVYKSFKAIGIVQATQQKVLSVLNDVNSYKQWFAFAESVRLLKETPREKTIYMVTSLPWPFSNEDMVYEITIENHANGETKMVLNGKPDFLPPIEGIVRMRDAKGYILVQPWKDETVITYVMYSELGGGIPTWLANKSVHLLPFYTLSNLKEIAENM